MLKYNYIGKSEIVLSSHFYLNWALSHAAIAVTTIAAEIHAFYSLLNSRQNGVVFSMFPAVNTSVIEDSFSKLICFVVALCTLFFLDLALNNFEEFL